MKDYKYRLENPLCQQVIESVIANSGTVTEYAFKRIHISMEKEDKTFCECALSKYPLSLAKALITTYNHQFSKIITNYNKEKHHGKYV